MKYKIIEEGNYNETFSIEIDNKIIAKGLKSEPIWIDKENAFIINYHEDSHPDDISYGKIFYGVIDTEGIFIIEPFFDNIEYDQFYSLFLCETGNQINLYNYDNKIGILYEEVSYPVLFYKENTKSRKFGFISEKYISNPNYIENTLKMILAY